MMKKCMCFFMVSMLVLGLAACGKSDSESSESVQPEVPVSSSEAAPTPEEPALDVAFLTGLEKGADYPEGQRALAVMINNLSSARQYPHRGLSDAQIVVEMEANAQITRLMGIYEDYKSMPEVGQVRSAREQFFQLILPYQMFFVHDGPAEYTEPVNIMLNNYDYAEFDLQPFYSGLTWWDNSYNASQEYREFTSGENITNVIEDNNLDDARKYSSSIFHFVPYNQPARVPEGGTSNSFTIQHTPGYNTSFDYDSSSHLYKMSMFNSSNGAVEPYIDTNNNEQLAFTNVLALYATFEIYPDTGNEALPKISFVGGPGYYLTEGGYEFIIWEKGSPEAPLRLYKGDKSGEEIQINPGTTYLGLVNDIYFEDFHNSLTQGTPVASGEVTGGETDIG